MENKLWSSKLTNESRPLENDKYGVVARTHVIPHTRWAFLRLLAGTFHDAATLPSSEFELDCRRDMFQVRDLADRQNRQIDRKGPSHCQFNLGTKLGKLESNKGMVPRRPASARTSNQKPHLDMARD